IGRYDAPIRADDVDALAVGSLSRAATQSNIFVSRQPSLMHVRRGVLNFTDNSHVLFQARNHQSISTAKLNVVVTLWALDSIREIDHQASGRLSAPKLRQ